MKNLFLGCIALFLTFGATAQPLPDLCALNINSFWDGVGDTYPIQAETGDGPGEFCDSIYAPTGMYKYIIGNYNNTIPQSWSDDQIYGLLGTGAINGIPGGTYLTASVLETRISVIEDVFQYYENPVMTLNSGNWLFDRVYIDGGTTLRVKAGARVEIKNALHLANNGKLLIEPGGEVVLKHTAAGQAIIDNDFGEIDGKITRQVLVSFDNYTAIDEADGDVLKFLVNSSLASINLDDMVRQIQDSLAVLGVKPTVQVGWWSEIDETDGYGYIANHSYHNSLTSSAALNTNLHSGDVVRDYNNFIANPAADFYNPAIFYNQYDPSYGVRIIPVYDSGNNTVSDLVGNAQVAALTGGVTTATEAEQDALATTPGDMFDPLIVNVQGANNAVASMVIEVTGTWKSQAVVGITDEAFDTNNAPEYPAELSVYYENAATILNTPTTISYASDIYSKQGSTTTDSYRNIDFTGLGMIHQFDGSQVDMSKVVNLVKNFSPRSARTFYDIKPLVSFMPERLYVADPVTGYSYNTLSGLSYPRKVADYLDFYDHENEMWRTIDLFNIDGMTHSEAIGDTLEPWDVVGFNHVNHYNIGDYDGGTLNLFSNSIKVDHSYTNMGGLASIVTADTTVYANDPIVRSYDIKSDVYDLNQRSILDYAAGKGVNNYPCSGSDNCEFDMAALDAMDEFTLLRLNARTATDTIALAYLPLAFGPQYSGGALGYLDAFEYSIAPDPAMYLLRQEDGQVGELMFGSYSRNVTDPSDTLYLVVDFDAFSFDLDGTSVLEYYIDSPIGQHPQLSWPAWWHIKAKNPGQNTQRIDPPNFKMPVTNTANTYPAPLNVGGTEDFNGDLIELHIRPTYGDFNTDDNITTSDMLLLLSQFGTTVNDNNMYLDYNNDGVIGQADLLGFLSNFGLMYPDDVYGSDDYMSPEQERIAFFATKKDNTHNAYDWRDYPGFSVQQQAYISTCVIRGNYVITDEYGTIVHGGSIRSSADNNIRLPSVLPTSAQLAASGTGNTLASPVGYQIHLFLDYYLDLPGLPTPVNYLCLGSNQPNDPFTTVPLFTGY
jgi:hypothetical protein